MLAGASARPIVYRMPDAAAALAAIARLSGQLVLVDHDAIDLLRVARTTRAPTVAVDPSVDAVAGSRHPGTRTGGLLGMVQAVILIEPMVEQDVGGPS